MTKSRKRSRAPDATPPHAPRPPAANPQVNLQTRKVLTKHYRAKHGVK